MKITFLFFTALLLPSAFFTTNCLANQQQNLPISTLANHNRHNSEIVKKRIQEAQKKLHLNDPADDLETARQLDIPFSRLQEYDANLRKMEAVFQRQLTSLERRESLKKEEESLGKKLKSQQESIITQRAPYNLSFYDNLLDDLNRAIEQEKTIGITYKSVKNSLEQAIKKLALAGQKAREATEELQEEGQTDKSLNLSWQLEYAQIEEELARAFLDLQRISVENTGTELRLTTLRKQIAQRHVDWVRSKLAFDQNDLDGLLESLEDRRTTLQNRIEILRLGQQDAENSWLVAQQNFEATLNGDDLAKARADAFLKAREAWRKTYQIVLEQTGTILLTLDQEKQFWQRRYALLKELTDFDIIDTWENQTTDYIDNIVRKINERERNQSNLQSEIAGIQKQLATEGLDPQLKRHVETHMAALNKMAERSFEYLSLLQGTRAIGQRLLDEINLRQKDIAFRKKIKNAGKVIQGIWEIELWVIDERSVTIRKLVIALSILIVGMLLARWLTQKIVRQVLLKTRVDKSTSSAIEKLLYCFALLILLVLAFRFVNIPLTVFTFLGGAIAIGVGFGAQNLLNNFISGFILLLEKPVKINDMIEVENNFGVIENIGLRCTQVRTHGNVHILVPNSSFLEKNIVNWTLSDPEIRAKVALGVASDSDPREVSRLMLKAALEHPKVLTQPEPIVLFDDIGDISYRFIVYFWVSMKNLQLLERRIVESDIRFRIIALFQRANITVAYPQRDVHLDTTQPLDLRIISEDVVAGSQETP